jgi:hypothetical protein
MRREQAGYPHTLSLSTYLDLTAFAACHLIAMNLYGG